MLLFNTQTDPRWRDEIMTECLTPNWEGKIWSDRIGRWGCVLTSIANISQFFLEQELTPNILNETFRIYKAYNYLQNPKCKEAEASNLIWDVIKAHFHNTLIINLNLTIDQFKNDFSKRYIARVIHEKTKTGHYINILEKHKNHFWCFDVEDGKIKRFEPDEITKIHEFEYIWRKI